MNNKIKTREKYLELKADEYRVLNEDPKKRDAEFTAFLKTEVSMDNQEETTGIISDVWESIGSLVYAIAFFSVWYFNGLLIAILAVLGLALVEALLPYIGQGLSYCKDKAFDGFNWVKSKVTSKKEVEGAQA